MSGPRIGSLCSGYEGLGMAVQSVLGGELAFVADNDPGAAKILAHRFPDVPNLGDITAVDWSAVGSVDILTAGFPCQPVSAAGRRKGVSDERWLFDDICMAIGRMVTRPGLLVFENVPGLLSANGGDAMGRVVRGLAALGYEFAYRLVRASDAGAPHRRERWFCVAWPAADAERDGLEGGWAAAWADTGRPAAPIVGRRPSDRGPVAEDPDRTAGRERREPAPGQAPGGRPRADAGRSGGAPAIADAECAELSREREPERRKPTAARRSANPPADPPGDGRDEGRPEPARLVGGPDAAECGDGSLADTDSAPRRRHKPGRGPGAAQGPAIAERAPEQPGRLHSGGRDTSAVAIAWGAYQPAIRRWEAILGRPAPRPTEPGRTGERLSPRFVEFLMGLPDGWVTDVPGLSRNAQLKALGNGVVPAQAAMALRMLLARTEQEEAA